MKICRQLALVGAVLAFLLVMAGTLGAQTPTGQITGTIKDTSGAVMSKVKVTAQNQLTGWTRETTTNDSGDYVFPMLPLGVYSVTANMQGFEVTRRSDIHLNVADVIRADLELHPGAVTQTVEVKGAAVVLDTETSSQSQLIGQRQIADLPLNSRNFSQFLLLNSSAVQSISAPEGGAAHSNWISINGARGTGLYYTLDGLDNTFDNVATVAVMISQDAIQEFKEQTATYSAEYGYASNQVNIVSKSGTNQLHGDGFEFIRNDDFDARNPFASTVPFLRQNQFGFVVGGPVYLPKVYDGRNKTFFMANFEDWIIHRATIMQGVVPDPEQVQGNFSTAASAAWPAFGTPACSAQLALNLPCLPIDPLTGQAFPGNQIPSSRFSRFAKESLALNLIPAPNCNPAICSGNNWKELVTLPTNQHQQTYKIDQDLGRFGKVFGRMTFAHFASSTPNTPDVPLSDANTIENEQSWQIAHTINFGGRTVNTFRVGRLGVTSNTCGTPESQSVLNAIGAQNLYSNINDCGRTYPGGNSMTNYIDFGGYDGETPSIAYTPTWEVSDSLSMIRGNHTLTMGFDYHRWLDVRNATVQLEGLYFFRNDTIALNGSNGTNGCSTPYCGTGNTIADMLLGYYSEASAAQPGPLSVPGQQGNELDYRWTYLAPYFQDDWKVTPRLTLNLGLRWDFRSDPYEEHNKMGWFDVNNPKGGYCVADPTLVTDGIATGVMESYCGRRNPASSSLTPFAPRFGFAWRPFGGDKTVVRGGYGIFWDTAEAYEMAGSGQIYPWQTSFDSTPPTEPLMPKLTDQLFPAPPTTMAPSTPAYLGGNTSTDSTYISENPRNPYVQQWDLSVQRQLSSTTTLEANYTGTKGTHLLARTNIGQAKGISNPAFCAEQNASGQYINLNNGDCPVDARLPYANFGGRFFDSIWASNSNYNAGNVKLERRTSSLALQAGYTWSKSLDDKSGAAGLGNAAAGWTGIMDNWNRALDYGRSDFDVGQSFVTNFIYQLPFGRGEHYLSKTNKVADAVLGGWRVGGIYTLQGGFPYSIFASDPFGLLDELYGFGNRAVEVGNPDLGSSRSLNEWFNTAAFAQPGVGQWGGARNNLRGPRIDNLDMNLAKTFTLRENLHLEFRGEFFNSLNHPQYAAPDYTLTDPTFGHINATNENAREIQLALKLIF